MEFNYNKKNPHQRSSRKLPQTRIDLQTSNPPPSITNSLKLRWGNGVEWLTCETSRIARSLKMLRMLQLWLQRRVTPTTIRNKKYSQTWNGRSGNVKRKSPRSSPSCKVTRYIRCSVSSHLVSPVSIVIRVSEVTAFFQFPHSRHLLWPVVVHIWPVTASFYGLGTVGDRVISVEGQGR